MKQTIIVRYSCTLCALIDASLTVQARTSEEDIKQWMDKLIVQLSDDHRRRSPGCHPKQLHNVKIPMDGAAWIGGPPIA